MKPLATALCAACLPVLGSLVTPVVPAAAAAPPRASADFDGDGYGDLAIGLPYESFGSKEGNGAVNVLYGSADGVRAARSQFWHQDVPGVLGVREHDRFGAALATGDFDGDGYSDLAAGSPSESIDGVGKKVGAVNVLYGSPTGLTAAGDELWREGADGIPGTPHDWEFFGATLAAGDFNGDGRHDLVIGAPRKEHEGRVYVLYGTTSGLVAGTASFPSPTGTGDAGFGERLAAGDFDGDGRDDLAVAAPRESSVEGSGVPHAVGNAGRVWVYSGGANGLTSTGVRSFDAETPGIDGLAEYNELFGTGLAAADTDADGRDELLIGVPHARSATRWGAVYELPGSASGPAATDARAWRQGIAGVPGDQGDHWFGWSLAAGDFDHDGRDDVAIGAPYDDIDGVRDVGSVTTLYGSATGLTASGSRQLHTDVAGIPQLNETGDHFGEVVSAGDFDRDGRWDLAVGTPNEMFKGHWGAGVLHTIPGSATGVTGAGSRLWHQDVPGIYGVVESLDHYGWAQAAAPG